MDARKNVILSTRYLDRMQRSLGWTIKHLEELRGQVQDPDSPTAKQAHCAPAATSEQFLRNEVLDELLEIRKHILRIYAFELRQGFEEVKLLFPDPEPSSL